MRSLVAKQPVAVGVCGSGSF